MIGCPFVSEIWEEVYGKRRLAAIKACKSVWIWKIGRTTCAKDEAVQFLDVAPRYRNRTFVLQKHQLFSTGVPGPAKQNFYETGKFLANRMSSELGQLLWQTVSRMKEKNVCLRIGTTCSGTDVCIPALRDLLAYFNDHLKAGGLSLKNLISHSLFIFIYIYLYIYVHIIYRSIYMYIYIDVNI